MNPWTYRGIKTAWWTKVSQSDDTGSERELRPRNITARRVWTSLSRRLSHGVMTRGDHGGPHCVHDGRAKTKVLAQMALKPNSWVCKGTRHKTDSRNCPGGGFRRRRPLRKTQLRYDEQAKMAEQRTTTDRRHGMQKARQEKGRATTVGW